MSFSVSWTPAATEQFEALKTAAETSAANRPPGKKKSSKQEGLFKQVAKAIRLLVSNPRHPGLNSHEFSSLPHPFERGGKVFEVYAQNQTPGAYRIFWCYGPGADRITIIAITPHP